MDRSIANQELFLPEEGAAQDKSNQASTADSGRYYADQNDVPSHEPPRSHVPAVNLIPATPSTIRSDSVRSTASQAMRTEPMSGALPHVVEEDMYGDGLPADQHSNVWASPSNQHPEDVIPPIPPKSPARFERSSPTASPSIPPTTATGATYVPTGTGDEFHDQVPPQADSNHYSQPATHEAVPISDSLAHNAPSEPPTYDQYRESRTDEPPPLPGPRPVPQTDAVGHSQSTVHPSVHLDSDQDYAYALQLQEEEENRAPPLPTRPRPSAPQPGLNTASSSRVLSSEEQDFELARRLQDEEDNATPALPIRPGQQLGSGLNEPPAFSRTPSTDRFQPPPRRTATDFGTDNPSDPIHYTRDPHKLIAYLVPFPTPQLKNAPSEAIPKRFLIYTPPPPPLQTPPEARRKIEFTKSNETKSSEAKVTSWPGFKGKMIRGANKAMGYTTNSNIDFLSRIQQPSASKTSPTPSRSPSPPFDHKDPLGNDTSAEDPTIQGHVTNKTVSLDTMIFVYSPAMNLTPEQMREEFVNTVMRTKSKAMRDSVIATGLLPVSLAVDIVLIAVSGIFEVNAAWAYFNIKGAKTARSVGKRLSSSTSSAPSSSAVASGGVPPPGESQAIDPEKPEAELQKEDKLKLEFRPATRIDVLSRYLQAECHKVEPKLFPEYRTPPSESDCLEAIGWAPHQTGSEKQNWEDEAWELQEVKDDLRLVIHKAAKEWRKYVVAFEKNPEKNIGK
ncbi:uncharacterized protein AB675_1075 [Cyphellophora attinorum]|uniref:Uncharacterized protein n=1 Tax=Cyphellophora attinorum TaxID=1664694 RepID=A0A0N1H6R3_9EURO|nr:uncharacterized protein AB675_1075 [Phialophora attinorum]KPI38047.1 hypothetical protein AB675_1075 [Phialophora attinorum]